MNLIDWLRADTRQDIPFLPRRFVSIHHVLPRLCAYRLRRDKQRKPWLEKAEEDKFRQALSDGALVAWLVVEGEEPSEVQPTSWLNEFVWHRAKFNLDMQKPDTDYDGEPVADEAWLALARAAGPPGIYSIEPNALLEWLGVAAVEPATPSAIDAQAQQMVERQDTFVRLRCALKSHLEFDGEPSWVRKKELVDEIVAILRVHGPKEYIRDAQRLADEIRPEAHKKKGNRSTGEQTAMQDWQKKMTEKRAQFRFEA